MRAQLEAEHDATKSENRKVLDRIAAKHEDELAKVREEHGKKSALARQLVAEKDVILKVRESKFPTNQLQFLEDKIGDIA